MSKLTHISNSSAGNLQDTARKIGAGNAFKNNCNILLVKAYKEILSEKKYKLTWEEDKFTANFKVKLDTICWQTGLPYFVAYQEHQLTDAILNGNVTAKAAKRIDIVFNTFDKPDGLKYGVEAKILVEKNRGSRNAKTLGKEYMSEGMDRFINKLYEMDGCMVGYVVDGHPGPIVSLLNNIFEENQRASEKLRDKHSIDSYESCYDSTHDKLTLKHLLFHFS